VTKARRQQVDAGRLKSRGRDVISVGVGRGLALFLAFFSLLNILSELRHPGFDANHWWIDLGFAGAWAPKVLLAGVSIFLLWYGIRPAFSRWRRAVTAILVGALVGVCVGNAVSFYWLVWRGAIKSGFLLAFSLIVCAALAIVLCAVVSRTGRSGHSRVLSSVVILVTVLVSAIAFAVGQMFCFGRTDYRRQADAIVVFGARVYADGRCSDALADRVRTGSRLYLDGLAQRLIFSGGPGDGAIHETEAMKQMAIRMGVPAGAIVLDEQGINTRATVENTCAMFKALGVKRVLVVSHFYHLPRIKMSYQRQRWEVYTVPAEETYVLTAMPYYIAREVAALWVYYLRPLVP